MDTEYRNRLARFLSEYIDILDSRLGYGDENVIRQGINMLINKGAFTEKELRNAALKEQGIILSEQFIKECLKITIKEKV